MSTSSEPVNTPTVEDSAPTTSSDKKEEVEQLSENVADLYLESFSFTTTAAIIGYVDSEYFGIH
jgi:hypothetical protein